MKCPKCGFVSYNYLDTCKRCGSSLSDYKRKIGIAEDAGPPPPVARESEGLTDREIPEAEARKRGLWKSLIVPEKKISEKAPDDIESLKKEKERLAEELEQAKKEAVEAARRESELAAREEAERIRSAAEIQARQDAERLRRQAEEEIEKLRAEARKEAEEMRQKAQQEIEDLQRKKPKLAGRTASPVASDAGGLLDLIEVFGDETGQDLAEAAENIPESVEVFPDDVPETLFPEPETEPAPAKPESPAAQAPEPKRRFADWRNRIEDEKPPNVPDAQDYLEYLARKAERPKEAGIVEPEPEKNTHDFPPPEEVDIFTKAKVPESEADFIEEGPGTQDGEEILEEIIEEEEVVKGGLFVRGIAAILDMTILFTILGLFLLIGKGVLSMQGGNFSWISYLKISGPIYILFLLITTVYFTLFVGGSGQTLGMMVLGLKVVNKRGESIGYALAFFRHVGALFSVLILGMGIWWIPLDLNKQGWHDKITQSVVIRV